MKNTFEKPILLVSHTSIRRRLALASRWSIVGTIISIAVIIVGISFMNWLDKQSSYSFGAITQIIPIEQNNNSIAKLQGPFKQDYVMNNTNLVTSHGKWLFMYGERIGKQEPQILVAQEQASLPVLGDLFTTSPTLWIRAIGDSKHIALITALVLLIWSGSIFRWTYTIALSAGAFFTLWHALHFAQWNGLLNLSSVGFYVVFILFLSGFIPLVNKHKQFKFVESLFAAGAWFLVSSNVLTWFGWHDTLGLALFAVALISPATIAAIISAYLLSKSFDASVIGTYSLLFLCVFVLVGQWIDREIVRNKLRKLNRQIFNSRPTRNKGRVTLAELLKQ